MISLPSNDATATHARPEARTLAYDRSDIATARRRLETQHPKLGGVGNRPSPGHQFIFEQVGQFDRSFHMLPVTTPAGRRERQEHTKPEESPGPLN